MANLPDFQIQYAKYKWEFLRRNKDYINACHKLLVLEEKYGKSESSDNASDSIMDDSLRDILHNLHNMGVGLSEITDGTARVYSKLIVEDFTALSKEEELFTDKKLFRQLVEAGRYALKQDDFEELMEIIIKMKNMKQAPHKHQKQINKDNRKFHPLNPYDIQKIKIRDKWALLDPINPYISYDDCIEELHEFPDPHEMMFGLLNCWIFFKRPLTIVTRWAPEWVAGFLDRNVSEKLSDDGKITVEIDLNYSKNQLFKEFKILLDEWKIKYENKFKEKQYHDFCKERNIQSFPIGDNLEKEFEKIYKQSLKKRNQKYEKKYHFDNFDDYLKVYDLRKKKVSWSNITTKLELNSIQTARNHYKAACDIIEKGIELYVK